MVYEVLRHIIFSHSTLDDLLNFELVMAFKGNFQCLNIVCYCQIHLDNYTHNYLCIYEYIGANNYGIKRSLYIMKYCVNQKI